MIGLSRKPCHKPRHSIPIKEETTHDCVTPVSVIIPIRNVMFSYKITEDIDTRVGEMTVCFVGPTILAKISTQNTT